MEKALNRMDMLSGEFNTEHQILKSEIKIVYQVIGIATSIVNFAVVLVKIL